METNDLLIGIDLGTSKSAIVTSRGLRSSFESVVGYPKDLIGVRLLGASYLVGDEVLNKSYLDMNYPLRDGVIKETGDQSRDAAHKLIEHAVKLADRQDGDRVCGIIGVPANASEANKELVLDIAKQFMDIAMVVSEPFMVAYGLDRLLNTIVIDIGAGTTDICAVKGHLPAAGDQISFTKAGNYINELLMGAIAISHPTAQLNINVARTLKEEHSFVGKEKAKVEVVLREEGKPFKVDITEELRSSCESILPEIIEHTETLIAGFDPSDQEAALASIILSGGGSKISGLGQMIADALKDYGTVNISIVEDIIFSGCDGALKLANDLPPEYWDQIGTTGTATDAATGAATGKELGD